MPLKTALTGRLLFYMSEPLQFMNFIHNWHKTSGSTQFFLWWKKFDDLVMTWQLHGDDFMMTWQLHGDDFVMTW